VELLVRTWNLFHGRTFPETRRAHLERMVRLVAADDPGIVCLQEVPLWGLPLLERWTGMRAVGAATKRALLGPLARIAQRVDARRVRSSLTGQANAVLVGRGLEVLSTDATQLSSQGERRLCQLLRVAREGSELLVANVHLSNRTPAASEELRRLESLVAGVERAVVCGDLNLRGTGLPGFSPRLPGIDQVLVRGLELLRQPAPWPDERRRLGAMLLSDHAPVEAAMIWR
jgi:endonuclease/exonuclease/phosphatase family metal-dependent hydrolase